MITRMYPDFSIFIIFQSVHTYQSIRVYLIRTRLSANTRRLLVVSRTFLSTKEYPLMISPRVTLHTYCKMLENSFHGNAGLWRGSLVPGECQNPLNFLCIFVLDTAQA